MNKSLIVTTYNEQESIIKLLKTIENLNIIPEEVVIVDGGSKDNTLMKLDQYISNNKNKNVSIRIYVKKGNRSVGRNEAIKQANSEIIAITDAGCTLEKNWLQKITEPFKNSQIDVVAGYYKSKPKNIFQKCLLPYVFVMPDKVDSDTFLPATRSMAIRKSVWEKIGGFDTSLSNNEDYAFSRKLKKYGMKIQFAKDAIVYWIPRDNIKQAFYMFYRFAKGDAEAKIYRPKVIFIILRYLIGLILLISTFLTKSLFPFSLLVFLTWSYIIWAIQKNFKYVKDPKAYFFLPLLQITSDIAIICGTVLVFTKRFFPFFVFLLFLWAIFTGINLPYVGQNAYNFIIYSLIAHNYNQFGYLATKLSSIISVGSSLPANPEYFIHHPPLLSIVLSIFLKAFGEEFWVGRLAIIFFMIGSIGVIFLIGKLVENKSFGYYSAGVMSLIPASSIFGKMIGQENLVLFFILLSTFFSLLFIYKNNTKFLVLSLLSISLATFSDWPAIFFSFFLLPLFIRYKKFKEGLLLPVVAIISGSISALWIAWIRSGFWDLGNAIESRSFLELQHLSNWPIYWITATISRIFLYFNPLIVVLSLACFLTIILGRKKLNDLKVLILSFFLFGAVHVTFYTEASFTHPYLLIYLLPFFTFASSIFITSVVNNKKYFQLFCFVTFSAVYLVLLVMFKNAQIESNIWRYQLADFSSKFLTKYETVVYNKYYAIDSEIWRYPLLINPIMSDRNDSEQFLEKYSHYVYSCEPNCKSYPAEINSLKKRYEYYYVYSDKAEVYIFLLKEKQKGINNQIKLNVSYEKENMFLGFYRKARDFLNVPQI